MADIQKILERVEALPHDWHMCGSMTAECLRAVVRHAGARKIKHSAETGSGKTTLLLSHLSEHHIVFSMNDYQGADTNSVTGVKNSPMFNAQAVEWVEGPSQRTLPPYQFQHKLQLALIDGPHGYPFPDLEYYYLYPHLEEGAVLIVDDIHIPTIRNLFNFLKEEEMFQLLEVVDKTAFFERTPAPLFDPFLDGWWLQKYNKSRFPIQDPSPADSTVEPVKRIDKPKLRQKKTVMFKVRREVQRLITQARQLLMI